MKKVLCILYMEFGEIPDGGDLANMRSLNIARKLYGEDEVDAFYVCEKGENRSVLTKVMALFRLPSDYYNGLTPDKLNSIIRLSHDYECVFITTTLLGLVAKRLKEAGYKGRIVTHFHNVETVYYESRIPRWLPFRSLILSCIYHNDAFSLRYADRSMALNRRDADMLEMLHGRRPDILIPITFEDKAASCIVDKETMTAQRPVCYFIGSNFPANSDGLLWFVKNVLPHVDIDFRIVGKDMDVLKQANSCLQDVDVRSNVPDLAEYFLMADFLIMPIFDGSGMKVKTCEALMFGKNIIGTTEAFEGYDVDVTQCGCLCNTADEFIAALRHYGEHPLPRFNSYSRRIFLEKYSQQSAEILYGKLMGDNN